MGYRSDILIQVETSTKSKLKEIREKFEGFKFEPDKIWEPKNLENTLMIKYELVKWYSGYFPEVDEIEDYLAELPVQENVQSVQFVRIGEDLEDSEYKDYDTGLNTRNWIGIHRSFDYGGAEENGEE